MADIFISYAREDRSRIEPLAKSLEGLGWSVFWDRTIPAGKTWRQVIGEALKTARSVIVAWSQNSIESDWVQEEADKGRQRKILVPILLDNVDPPLGFGTIQAADLVNWDPAQSSPEFEKLIAAISIILGPSPRQVKEAEQGAEEERKRNEEEKSKHKEEERRKAEEESQRLEIEKRRIAEEKQKRAEVERTAEEKRKRKEIEAKRKAEEERKRKEAEVEVDRARKEQVGRKAEPPQAPLLEAEAIRPEFAEPVKKRSNSLIGAMIALVLAIVVGLAWWFSREPRIPDTRTIEAPKVPLEAQEVQKPAVKSLEPKVMPPSPVPKQAPIQSQLKLSQPFRREGRTVSVGDAKSMVLAYNFVHKDWNPKGTGIKHEYSRTNIGGNEIVVDNSASLLWQAKPSENRFKYADAVHFVRQLNATKFAGRSTWRLPTLEEAMSLVSAKNYKEEVGSELDYYLDPIFTFIWQRFPIWTSDYRDEKNTWVVRFEYAISDVFETNGPYYAVVLAVSSMD